MFVSKGGGRMEFGKKYIFFFMVRVSEQVAIVGVAKSDKSQ